jgi:uncharacterized SAM-binding protein YcdF (DUF218 family)
MIREVEKTPETPVLNKQVIKLLTSLCFREDDKQEEVDMIFVYGSFKYYKLLANFIKDLLKPGLSKKVLITGGETSEFGAESNLVLDEIKPDDYSYIKFILEKKSTNTLGNVTEALKVHDFSKYKKILFIFKTHGAGRGYLTLKKFLPNTTILQKTWSPEPVISKTNWFNNEASIRRVWGEFLRIKKYGERGDIHYPQKIKEVVEKIESLVI